VKKLLLVVGLLLAVGITCAGQQVNVELLGYSGGQWQNGYPYSASINGGSAINVMCDDYFHGGNPGDQWPANLTNLGTGDLSLTRFNQLQGALTLYEEVGWLLLETQVEQQNQWKDMNGAAWFIFDNNAPLDQGAQFWLNAAEQEAQGGFKGVDFTKVEIITPTNQHDPDPNGPQEFMTIVGSGGGTTPEPGTFILLGTGLLGLLGRKFLT